MKKDRGLFLSAMTIINLIIVTLGFLIISALSHLISGGSGHLQTLPNWVIPVTQVLLIAEAVSLIAIWKLKKWGPFVFFGVVIASIFINFIPGRDSSNAGFSMSTLLFSALFGWAIYRKWKLFS